MKMGTKQQYNNQDRYVNDLVPPRRGGAMVLDKLPGLGRPTVWMTVEQGLTALAVGAGRGYLEIFTLLYLFSSLSPSLWETVRYRLKYCLKGPLNPKQPTSQPNPPRKWTILYSVWCIT